MDTKGRICRCPVCETVIDVLDDCGLEINCCGRTLEPLPEKHRYRGRHRHVPLIDRQEQLVHVKVGTLSHEMKQDHHVQWIELVAGRTRLRRYLTPGEKPEAAFKVDADDTELVARAYCNLHGLWTSACDQPARLQAERQLENAQA